MIGIIGGFPMRKISLLVLLLAACSKNNNTEMSLYHEDGRAKPVIAVASMIDTTSFDCPWSLSEELTSMVVKKIEGGGKIFVQSNVDSPFAENPFGNDLSWVKREFQNQEFVVFLELVEHAAIPVLRGNKKLINPSPPELSTNLEMAVRIRVLDLRSQTPKIVLQEMVRESYYIPKTLLPTDYNQTVWGSDEYQNTPMGIAHRQLIQEIALRVSDYILLAR